MNLLLHARARQGGRPSLPARLPPPPPLPAGEARRVALLQSLGILDTPPCPELDRVTRLAARLLGMPVALVSLVDAERQWFKSRVGLALAETGRAISFCAHAICREGPMVVEDARRDPRFRDNPAVTGYPRIVFYAGQPLLSREGHALGTLCVIDHRPRTLDAAGREALADLATLAQDVLQRLELERETDVLGRDSRRLASALRESERRYLALFNNRTSGLMHLRLVLNAAGEAVNYRIEAVNDAYGRIMGLRREDVEGRLVTEAFPGIDANPDFDFLEPYARVALRGEEARFERWFAPLQRWFSVHAFSPARGECITLFSDITEQKRTEAALRASEQALRATFEQAAIGIVHVGPDGRFRRANQKFCDMLGYAEEELLAMHFTELSPPEEHRRGLEVFARTMAGDLATFTLEKRYQRKDGRVIWGRISVTAVRDEAANATLYNLVMVEDITSRKRVEEGHARLLLELEAAADDANHSRAQLQAVFSAIDEGIAVFDMQGNLILLNQAMACINRFSSPEDMLRPLSFFEKFYELRDGQGRRLAPEQWPVSRVLAGERFSGEELQVCRMDIGLETCQDFSGAPVHDEEGRQVMAVVVTRDVSARKAMEAELQESREALERRVAERTAELAAANAALRREQERTRVVLETATDAYVAADEQARVIAWNRAAERMFGWRAEEVMGLPVGEILVPMRFRRAHDAGFAGGFAADAAEVPHGREFTARHRDGHEFPVEISLSRNEYAGGWSVSAFLRDISERKRGEEALRRAHDELAQSLAAEQEAARNAEAAKQRAEAAMRAAEAANQAKTDFLATMSHEIRTPLNGVIGFNGLLLDGPLGEDKRQYAELARRSGEALLHLLNDFLDFSKIEAGHLDLEPVDFDPHLEASHALSLVRESAQKKGLQLDLDCAAPPRVRGDAARLRQILLNLLSNAVKFTEQGRVGLSCAQLPPVPDDARCWLQFEVRDTGIGIEAGKLERLFQPFVQADASTTRRFGGTGLGLAISRRLAEAMGGEVGVRSEPGVGSTFWLRLPFTAVAAAAPAPAPAPDLPAAQPGAPRGRVLVVEDNPVSQLMAAEMLKRLGCRVDVAGNGLEAVEAMRRLPYDLVLMDCDMPLMNGFDATRAIRVEERGKRRVPIVAITASALKGDSERCFAVGMDDFMSKPFRLQDMARTVERWLGSSPRD